MLLIEGRRHSSHKKYQNEEYTASSIGTLIPSDCCKSFNTKQTSETGIVGCTSTFYSSDQILAFLQLPLNSSTCLASVFLWRNVLHLHFTSFTSSLQSKSHHETSFLSKPISIYRQWTSHCDCYGNFCVYWPWQWGRNFLSSYRRSISHVVRFLGLLGVYFRDNLQQYLDSILW